MEQGAVRRKSLFVRAGCAALAGVLALGFLLVPSAGSQVPLKDQKVLASATGTVLHAGVLNSGGTKLVDANVAFSGAVYDSAGLAKASYNEMQRKFAPAALKKLAYGRGVGLDAGLAASPNKPNQILLAGLAEKASPVGGLVTKEIGPLDLDPLAWAALLRGRAQAAGAGDECAVGSDLSSSLAYVADAQLLDMGAGTTSASSAKSSPAAPAAAVTAPLQQVKETVEQVAQPVNGLLGRVAPQVVNEPAPQQQPTTQKPAAQKAAATSQAPSVPVEGLEAPIVALDADGPARAISQSTSRTRLIGQRAKNGDLLGRNFGVWSEVRETIAPVTLFEGTPYELTLEFLGEWVLQAVATGMPGGAYIHYGPGSVSPSSPVLRLIDKSGITDVLTLQDLLGSEGLVIEIPGVAEVAIGEDPRAIGGNADSAPAIASNGTLAAAAVDVVRVRVLPGAPAELTDLRIGHMEVRSAAPEGGVRCSIPVSKTPSVKSADVGEVFGVDFKVTNPYDCALTGVTIVDNITTKDAARFAVVSAPKATDFTSGSGLDKGKITWKLGNLAPHTSKSVSASFRALEGAGMIIDEATASGAIDDCGQQGATVSGVDVKAVNAAVRGTTPSVEVSVKGATVAGISEENREIPLTGAPIALLLTIALALMGAGGAALTLAYRYR